MLAFLTFYVRVCSLVDTKVMGSTQPFRDLIPATNLAEMTTCLITHPFTMPEIGEWLTFRGGGGDICEFRTWKASTGGCILQTIL